MISNTNSVLNKIRNSKKYLTKSFFGFFILLIANTSCNNNDDDNVIVPVEKGYKQVNLVADTDTYDVLRVDANLKNPWGIALSPTGSFWISANHTGLSTIYDRNGDELLAPVNLNPDGAPTGVVYNENTSSFGGNHFIFAGEDGIISAWSSGSSTTIVADLSEDGAVYKGIAIGTDAGEDFLYAANFKGNSIDVFDSEFNQVDNKPFTDATIPEGFAPFNIYNHDGKLYVTYAKLKGPDNEDDEAGVGNGYVNIFETDGTLVERFASQGKLNSPWAVVDAPTGFGLGSGIILVGNFGDGYINIFDEDGNYKGQLMDNDTPISIEGLWALQFPENGVPAGDQNQLFFTAGPADETHGLFGYIAKK